MRVLRGLLWFATLVVLFALAGQLVIERYELRQRGRALIHTAYEADSLVTYWKTLKCIPRGR